MFFVLAGEVRLVRLSRSGSEIVLQRARDGILAEASLDQPAYHCDALASIPTTVLRVPREIDSAGTKGRALRRSVARRSCRDELRRLRAQCERLSLNTAHERIIHYLETEGENGVLVLAQTKKQWAAELGLSHEALYRSLAQMEKSGSIRIEGRILRLGKPR